MVEVKILEERDLRFVSDQIMDRLNTGTYPILVWGHIIFGEGSPTCEIVVDADQKRYKFITNIVNIPGNEKGKVEIYPYGLNGKGKKHSSLFGDESEKNIFGILKKAYEKELITPQQYIEYARNAEKSLEESQKEAARNLKLNVYEWDFTGGVVGFLIGMALAEYFEVKPQPYSYIIGILTSLSGFIGSQKRERSLKTKTLQENNQFLKKIKDDLESKLAES